MTKLEQKLKELGYELCMTQEIYKPNFHIIKIYSKKVNDDKFNRISICNNVICGTPKISNEIEMQKDLEELKKYESK